MENAPKKQPEAVGVKNFASRMTEAELFRHRLNLHFMSKVLTIQVLQYNIDTVRSVLKRQREQLVREFPDMKDEVEKICSDA